MLDCKLNYMYTNFNAPVNINTAYWTKSKICDSILCENHLNSRSSAKLFLIGLTQLRFDTKYYDFDGYKLESTLEWG